ncbi:centromere DNA-binding protein complex CBF3 subunit [Hirsutella rhossiliensis]|uniref:Centromere DNA-binding protein complex CBF3 subunit n=1 Tax=Hirsutella rhossiliensis TaxID=111463 RepID=A0A9P8N851_9HYPO|nr:centromere DNA-binding protein complex CBF3 subunit [Hirsutella rhossiliensis]KAH0968730.1 centromere DNA-binding protein complex CBF3 subunit [Hirsutella rhossiliensis]
MAADDSYTAADDRARLVPYARAAADGSLYSWPDGELVTPDKLAAWLKEDILLRRVVPPQKKPRARGKVRATATARPYRGRKPGRSFEVPLAEAAELLADDREGYVPPTGLATAAVDLTEGSLLTRGTIDAYIAAVIEPWRLQVAHGNSNTENPGAPPKTSVRESTSSSATTTSYGENRRKMELADLSLLDYPPSEGPTPVVDWTGIGSRSSSGGTASRSSYPTQLQETWRIFGAAGLIASKKTHLPRRVGAQDAETHGTSLAQISQAGRWNQSVLCQAYLTHLPRQFMRIVAGFSASRGLLARAAHEPPPLPVATVLRLRPFSGPEWDEFAVAVRSTAVGAMEPNSQRLAIRLEARLDGIQGGLDALLQGKVPITFTGYFGAGSAEALAPAPAPAPSTVPTLNLNTAPAPAPDPEPLVPGMPIVTALARVFTVGDVWKEWEEGVQFCRRKVIWDELLARMASGKCKEAAVAELELLRAGRSLNRLVDELKQRRRRGQDRGQARARYGYR